MVKDFVAEIIGRQSSGTEKMVGKDGHKPLTVVVNFELVKNLLEARAQAFQSIVLTYAERYNLDPALIMAMIHTESAFNPRASSHAQAYGLMQLVPHTAGKEAYQRIYGQIRELTPQYLYDPDNNIELGAAYFNILRDGYMGSIVDPTSRTYCAVAAYHAGPSSVGRAFISKPSILKAAPIINGLKPSDVYKRLVEALPAIESRNYLRKVIRRVSKYSRWYSKNKDAQASVNWGNSKL
jgi:membrane-bound lytic murein transglycosylase C